ncbi:hypothetical protein V7S43_018717 [Phytophthora oleae]|uniref:HTH CENPB-type domain-containing protein n=1 Tax=Phytophthora oleae TaxID=2107226 RepID=A0ABD3EQC2_9STRA
MRATVAKFYVSLADEFYESKRTMILRWCRQRPKLIKASLEGKGTHTNIQNVGVGTVLSNELELDIVYWVNELREDGIPISTRMLADKAQQVAVNADVRDFHASDKWASGFKRRHHFSLHSPTRQSQVCPADIDRYAAAFVAVVEATVRDLGV